MASLLLKKVRGRRNLEAAWRVIEENGRTSKSLAVKGEIEKFREDATRNLDRLYRRMQAGLFRFPPAKGIPLPKGTDADGRMKEGIRPIVLATTEARIVQRAILNVLTGLPALEKYFANPNSFGGMRKSERRLRSAVPAAIEATLSSIGTGARFVMCADISGFFTRISKTAVADIVSGAAADAEFTDFFRDAIRVELSNLAELRELGAQFPIEDIGVAQGNSLSPLLGNILLHEFDRRMNEGDCHCKRYIDDFVVLGPTAAAVAARMKLAKRLLATHGMELSSAKSSIAPIAIENGFEFLGIELANGWIRPSKKAQKRLISNIEAEFNQSSKAFEGCRRGGKIDKSRSLIATLKRVDGIARGWSKHYRFCNDEALLRRLDEQIDDRIRSYVGGYRTARERTRKEDHRALLGLDQWRLMIAKRSNGQSARLPLPRLLLRIPE
jgi:retron-type reverse transcriptase